MKIKFRIPIYRKVFTVPLSSKQLTEPELAIEERKFHDFAAYQK